MCFFIVVPLGSYFDFYNSWQNEMERNGKINVLVVHYEDLHKVREMKVCSNIYEHADFLK